MNPARIQCNRQAFGRTNPKPSVHHSRGFCVKAWVWPVELGHLPGLLSLKLCCSKCKHTNPPPFPSGCGQCLTSLLLSNGWGDCLLHLTFDPGHVLVTCGQTAMQQCSKVVNDDFIPPKWSFGRNSSLLQSYTAASTQILKHGHGASFVLGLPWLFFDHVEPLTRKRMLSALSAKPQHHSLGLLVIPAFRGGGGGAPPPRSAHLALVADGNRPDDRAHLAPLAVQLCHLALLVVYVRSAHCL